MSKETAFTEINYLFNSIENQDKSNSFKTEELLIILDKLQKEQYHLGFKNGIKHSIKILNELEKEI